MAANITRTVASTAPLVPVDLAAIRAELALEGRTANETIPGGVYLSSADGTTLINCWNQTIDSCGKVLNSTPLVREWA